MKFTCKQQDLSRGLAAVSHAVSSRSTLPILLNIMITTDNGRVKLSASNLEIGINYWVDAQIHEEGTTTVPAKLFTDLVANLPQGPIDLAAEDGTHTLNVKSQGSNANIKGMDAAEFPLIPGAEAGESPVVLDATLLKEVIAQVAFAAADDDSRPILTGMLVQVGEEQLTFAAADAFRLAVRFLPMPGLDQPGEDILVPARTMVELARILPAEGTVELTVTPNRSQVLFHTQNIDLVSRLIDGKFPNFRQIMPKEHSTRAVVETRQFSEAVKRAALFARDSSNITRLKVASGNGGGQDDSSLTIEAMAEDLGDNTSTLSAAVDGSDLQITFNVKYLADVLNVIGTAEVAFEANAASNPGVIKPVSADDYTYVIMPMQVSR